MTKNQGVPGGSLSPQRLAAVSVFVLAALTGKLLSPAVHPAPHRPDPQTQDASRLSYDLDVAVTNVHVVVKGKDGRGITGLGPENFQVYEDGALQKLTNFYEMNPAQVQGYPARPEDVPGKDPRLQPMIPDQAKNKIIFFFDNRHLHPLNRNSVIKKLQSFISKNFEKGKNNEGMLIFVEQRLDIIQGFTSNPHSLLRAAESLQGYPSDALLRERSWQNLNEEINQIAASAGGLDSEDRFRQSMAYARNYVEEEMNHLGFSIQSLEALLTDLSGIKGRKIILYISDRLPINPGDEVFSLIDQLFALGSARTEAMNYDATPLFKEFIARSNAKEISIYAIRADELDASISSADRAKTWNVNSRGLRPTLPGASRMNDGLEMISRETGGTSISAKRDFDAGLALIEDDITHYYSLGYKSIYPADNKYHAIDVKIAGIEGEYEVRFRKGYVKSPAEERIKENVVARLFLGRQDNPLGIQIQALPVEKTPFGGYRLTLKLLVPIHKITLVPQGREHAGRIKIVVAMLDSKDSWSDPVELFQDIKIPLRDLEEAQKRYFPYLAEMELKPESYIISVAVSDLLGSMTSYLQLRKDIAE